jgi:hypothetical protein
MMQPHSTLFKDDGAIPNSRYAVLLYHGAVELDGNDPRHRWRNVLREIIGQVRGETGFTSFIIITAPVTKCSASIEAQPLCGSGENEDKILS